MTFSADLVSLVERADSAGVPSRVLDVARLRLLDGVSVLDAGAASKLAAVVDRYLALRGHGGTREDRRHEPWHRGLATEELAFMLGAWAFAYNYADTSLASVAHPGSTVIPALLAGARDRKISGDRALRAVVAGYDVTDAVARVLNQGPPRMGNQIRGFRPTAMAGPFGTVAVLAVLWELEPDTTQRAFEIASNLAAGLRRQSGGPVSSIRIQSGLATRAGVAATLLALAGVRGENELLEGEGGFFSAHADGSAQVLDLAAHTREDQWFIEPVAVKLHCTAHNLAAALDAVVECARTRTRDPENIARIEVEVPAAHARIGARRKREPANFAEARNSYEFCAALAAVTADYLWPSRLRAYLGDPTVLRLRDLVELSPSARLTEIFDNDVGTWPARARITDLSGRSDESEVIRPAGTGAGIEVEGAVERKVRQLTSGSPPEFAAGLIDFCKNRIGACGDIEKGLLDVGLFGHREERERWD